MQSVDDQSLRSKYDLASVGYSFVPAEDLTLPADALRHHRSLAAEWNDLQTDNYLKDGATFRERRFGRYAFWPREGKAKLLKHRPYYQSPQANAYAGGIHRVVAPLTRSFVDNPLVDRFIRFDFERFPVDERWMDGPWEVACHLFRIIGTTSRFGEPTPEGIHRYEIDFGAMHLMARINVQGGHSLIHDEDGAIRRELCLERNLDTLYWADQSILHSVTPITPAQPDSPAIRDILILGYRHDPSVVEHA